jgi:hypothetical protein
MGNLLMAYTEQTRIVGEIPAARVPEGISAVSTVDVNQFEGQSQIELLSLILLEMRIMNQQLYELPGLLANGLPAQDEPQTMRIEPSMFNI